VAEAGERDLASVLAVAVPAECLVVAARARVALARAVAAGPELLAQVAVFGKAAEEAREAPVEV
jgi:hypothetical protein